MTKFVEMRSKLSVIFLTVFIDLIGFGIIIPLSPYLARKYHADSFEIGLLMASFSLFQFLASPFWGNLSDRIGRRPVILICMAGSVFSYLLFAFANHLAILYLARSLAGVFGGSISTAHAYIADITPPDKRSQGMGLLGVAFGLGFIIGPLMGALFASIGNILGSEPPFGMNFSAVGAALLCFFNLIFAFVVLKESNFNLQKSRKQSVRNKLKEVFLMQKKPKIGLLNSVFFLSGFAMAQMESMLFPLMADRFNWDLKLSSYGFAYVGILMVFVQGFLIRKVIPKFGEYRVLFFGLILFSLSLIAIAFAQNILFMALAMTILAIGNGLMRPPNVGLISLAASADEQGQVMGVVNSLASLGRVLGPLLGGFLYSEVSSSAPFLCASVMIILAIYLTYLSQSLRVRV